jgi:hypothetical protein
LAVLLLAGIRYTPLEVRDSEEPFFSQFSRGLGRLGARPRLLWLGLLMQVPFVVVIAALPVLPGAAGTERAVPQPPGRAGLRWNVPLRPEQHPLKILLTSTLMEIVDKEQFGRAMALWTGISSLMQVGLSFALGAALDRVSENHG